MSRVPKMHTTDQLDGLANMIKRTALEISVAHSDLEERWPDWVVAVGPTDDGTECSIAFRAISNLAAFLAKLAERFRAIAVSNDPLNSIFSSGVVLTELNHAVPRNWARHEPFCSA